MVPGAFQHVMEFWICIRSSFSSQRPGAISSFQKLLSKFWVESLDNMTVQSFKGVLVLRNIVCEFSKRSEQKLWCTFMFVYIIWFQNRNGCTRYFSFLERLLTTLYVFYWCRSCQIVIKVVLITGNLFFHTYLVSNIINFSFLWFNRCQALPFLLRAACSLHLSFYVLFRFFFLIQSSRSTIYTPRYRGLGSCDIFILLINICQSKECHARFLTQEYNVLDDLRWVQETWNDGAKELVFVMQQKASRSQQPPELSGFCCSKDAILRTLAPSRFVNSCGRLWRLALTPRKMVLSRFW